MWPKPCSLAAGHRCHLSKQRSGPGVDRQPNLRIQQNVRHSKHFQNTSLQIHSDIKSDIHRPWTTCLQLVLCWDVGHQWQLWGEDIPKTSPPPQAHLQQDLQKETTWSHGQWNQRVCPCPEFLGSNALPRNYGDIISTVRQLTQFGSILIACLLLWHWLDLLRLVCQSARLGLDWADLTGLLKTMDSPYIKASHHFSGPINFPLECETSHPVCPLRGSRPPEKTSSIKRY